MATEQCQMESTTRAMGKLSTEYPDQKEQESDSEMLKNFMAENKYAVSEKPSSDDIEQINAFVSAESSAQSEIPRMRQLCNGMAMEFFVEAEATEWIYLTNKSAENSEDEAVIECKQIKEGENAIAVFAVGDDWKIITPYAYSENGAVAGEQIMLMEAANSDEEVVAKFLRGNPAANQAAPTEEEVEQILAFVVADEPKCDIMVAQVCNGMCMEFTCEGAEWIYVTNKDSDGEESVVACKQGSKAVFEVLDGWSNITPYAYMDEEATQGEEIILADEEDYPDFEQMSKMEVDEFYKNIEPAYEKDAFQSDKGSFKVTKEGSNLKIEMGIPADHVWARTADGKLVGAVQFPSEPEDMVADFECDDDVEEVRVYAFTQDGEANSVTIGAEFSL